MKKTRSTVVLLLIIAILALAVGYAAMSVTLRINGTLAASVDDSNFKVLFTQSTNEEPVVASTTIEPTVTTAIDANDDKLATFSVTGFTAAGDSVVLKYTVKNGSEDLNATVTSSVDLTGLANSEYFDVEASFASGSAVSTTTIAAQDTAILYVTVSCIKTPTADVASATKEGIVTLIANVVE